MIKGMILAIVALTPHYPEGAKLVITGHHFWVKTVAFNPSGEILASAGGDGVIMLWDGHNGRYLATLPGHNEEVTKVKFIPGSNYLVSVGHDGLYIVWDVEALKKVSEADMQKPISSLAFSPDGSRYAIGFEDGSIQIFNAKTGSPIASLTAHDEIVKDLEFLPDNRLISVSSDGTAKLWNDANLVGSVPLGDVGGQSIAVSKDGKMIVIGTENGFLFFIDPANFQVISKLEAHAGAISDMLFTSDGILITASEDSTIKIWNLEKRSPKFTLRGHKDGLYALAISPDGKILASGGADKAVALWDISKGQLIAMHVIYAKWITSLAFDKSGNILLSGSFYSPIRYWDLRNGGLIGEGSNGEMVKVSPSGKYLAVAGSLDSLLIYDLQSGQLLFSIPTPQNLIFTIDFSPAENMIAFSGMTRPLKVYSLPELKKIIEYQASRAGYRSVKFWGNDKLIVGGFDGKITVIDLKSGTKLVEFQAHDNPITNIVFTLDGSRVFTSDRGGVIKAWSLPDFSLLFSKQAHDHSVSGLVLTKENNALISAGLDARIKFWNPNNGNLIKEIDWGHTEGISSLAISPDGRFFATGGTDRRIIIWETEHFLPR